MEISMNHGEGEFSYKQNSSTIPGKLFTHKVRPMVENVIKDQLIRNVAKQCKVLNVADLGCGIGPTPNALITTVMETVSRVSKEMKGNDTQKTEVQVYMSDLPSSDFNMLFRDIAKIQEPTRDDDRPQCFVMGVPGNFYGRLFPTKSLHFVHSSAALHWLSQVPVGVCNEQGKAMNKGNIISSDTSPPDVVKSYFAQFKHDFTCFLTCRSKEVITDGQMVLAFPLRPSINPCQQFLLASLYQALASLVSKGVITIEKLDSFDMPVYFPCKEEIEGLISEEGSFEIDKMEVTIDNAASEIKDTYLRAEALSKFIRSTSETLISYHFGAQIWDALPGAFLQVILKHLESNNDPIIMQTPVLVMLLSRKLD